MKSYHFFQKFMSNFCVIKVSKFNLEYCHFVYAPSEDTYLLLSVLPNCKVETALDIGTGTGIIALHLSSIAKQVIAVDINPFAIFCARKNVRRNGLTNRIIVFYSDLFSNIPANLRFDIITFNMPYLNTYSKDQHIVTWDYLASWSIYEPSDILSQCLKYAKDYMKPSASIYFIVSSLFNFKKVLNAYSHIYSFKIIKKIDFFYERIFAIRGVLHDAE